MSNRYRFDEVAHVHSLDNKPLIGTTTALGIIGKELSWWSSGMACKEMGWLPKNRDENNQEINRYDKAGLEERQLQRITAAGVKLTDIKLMTIKQYLTLLDTAYRAHHEHKEARAVEGTDVHKLVEDYIHFKMNGGEVVADDELFPYVPPESIQPFVRWCDKNVKRFLFSEIHCYSERLWVGGKTDFGYESIQGDYVLADVKSREKWYFSDMAQCGGYALQIIENGGLDKNGKDIFRLDKPFTAHAMFPITEKFKEPFISAHCQDNEDAFENAVNLYKAKQRFEGK